MPFIPHTEDEIREMLSTIGVETVEDLFDEIPSDLKTHSFDSIPKAMNEMEVFRFIKECANRNVEVSSFIGAGAYDHHIPGVIWDLATRGEWITAYTPYQAEASQGGLQLIYEYQTMMASLTGMDASNASLYDGATALAEAVLMAVRANKKSKSNRVFLPQTIHPFYRDTVRTIVTAQDIELIDIPFDLKTGRIDRKVLAEYAGQDITAFVIPQPNFFGVLEEVDALTKWGCDHNALVIGLINPLSLGLLKAPGAWGAQGADIVCGEGQPFGIPLSSGGPYLGVMCCKEKYLRQLPGRIVGRTVDVKGAPGFVLTLQAREQHIRRSKATSNICTNQGLMMTAATIYMSLLGPSGLRRVAEVCHSKMNQFVEKVTAIEGVTLLFNSPYFHEVVLQFPRSAKEIVSQLMEERIEAGFVLSEMGDKMDRALLVCCTETTTNDDVNRYVEQLRRVLSCQ